MVRNRDDGETLESPICGGILQNGVAFGADRVLDLITIRYVWHSLFGFSHIVGQVKGSMKTDQDFHGDCGLVNSPIKIHFPTLIFGLYCAFWQEKRIIGIEPWREHNGTIFRGKYGTPRLTMLRQCEIGFAFHLVNVEQSGSPTDATGESFC